MAWYHRPLSPPPPFTGWIYALSGIKLDDPTIIKVGRTCYEHPGTRAVMVMPYGGGAGGRLWASRSADVIAHERLAHKALDDYRYHGGPYRRECYICEVPQVLDVLEQVTGNRPYHFPKFVEEGCPDGYLRSPALLEYDPSVRLRYRAIRQDWTEFPRGPRTCAE